MTRTHDIDLDELFNAIQLQGATIRELEKKVAMQDERIAEASLKANQVGRSSSLLSTFADLFRGLSDPLHARGGIHHQSI